MFDFLKVRGLSDFEIIGFTDHRFTIHRRDDAILLWLHKNTEALEITHFVILDDHDVFSYNAKTSAHFVMTYYIAPSPTIGRVIVDNRKVRGGLTIDSVEKAVKILEEQSWQMPFQHHHDPSPGGLLPDTPSED